jgi:pilus assembly protein Flp/PilA
MQNLFTRFVEDESGATAIEYGLIAALIAVGIIGGATAIGDQVNQKFDDVALAVDGTGAEANETNTANIDTAAG